MNDMKSLSFEAAKGVQLDKRFGRGTVLLFAETFLADVAHQLRHALSIRKALRN